MLPVAKPCDGAMRFGGVGEPREHRGNGLPQLLRVIFGPSRLREMRRRRLRGLGHDAPFQIDGDGADAAGAEIEAGEQRLRPAQAPSP